jgi:hypothetical protein
MEFMSDLFVGLVYEVELVEFHAQRTCKFQAPQNLLNRPRTYEVFLLRVLLPSMVNDSQTDLSVRTST